MSDDIRDYKADRRSEQVFLVERPVWPVWAVAGPPLAALVLPTIFSNQSREFFLNFPLVLVFVISATMAASFVITALSWQHFKSVTRFPFVFGVAAPAKMVADRDGESLADLLNRIAPNHPLSLFRESEAITRRLSLRAFTALVAMSFVSVCLTGFVDALAAIGSFKNLPGPLLPGSFWITLPLSAMTVVALLLALVIAMGEFVRIGVLQKRFGRSWTSRTNPNTEGSPSAG